MRNIIILGPGKSGTTYLRSRLPNSTVLHNISSSRFHLINLARQIAFFFRLMISNNLVILPFRSDKARRKSFFWNDLENALLQYKKLGPDYKSTRHETAEVFLKACFEHYPFETYDEWYRRNHLSMIIKLSSERRKKSKFFRSDVIMCPLREIDDLLVELSRSINVLFEEPKYNKKQEFWHRILHEYIEGEDSGCE